MKKVQNNINEPLLPENIATTSDTYKIVESINLLQQMETIDSAGALRKVKERISFKKAGKWMTFIQRAAAVLLLPLLSFIIWQAIQINDFNKSIVQHEVTTPPTLRSVFNLPDGTKVWMNGNTTITYPTFFKGNERLVQLDGEAYFEVAHNKQKPFLVKSGKILVEAVGTEFDCLSFHDDTEQKMLLTKGKVNILMESVKGRKKLTSLSPNEMAVFNNEKKKLRVKKVDPEKYIAWREGKIIFKNDIFPDMLKKLERWYNVSFIYDENIQTDYAFTGSFEGEELSQILNCIEITTPIRFEILKAEKDENEMYQKIKIKIRNKK